MGLVFQNPDIQLFCPTVKEDIMFGPLQLGAGKERDQKTLRRNGRNPGYRRSPGALASSVKYRRKTQSGDSLHIDGRSGSFVLDEPTAGLDPLTTRHIIDFLIQVTVLVKQ